MEMPPGNGSASGFHGDLHSTQSENGYGVSPLPPDKSPRLPLFFRGANEKKTTKDGQVPKKRGPKPDSKPATSRRQELNRQAQRTHRERKEKYIEDLENAAVAEKNAKSMLIREKEAAVAQRDAALREVERLKQLLRLNDIPDEPITRLPLNVQTSFHALSPRWQSRTAGNSRIEEGSLPVYSSATHSTGQGPSPTSATVSNYSLPNSIDHPRSKVDGIQIPQKVSLREVDMTQLFVDFVLSLETICHDHQQMLLERSVKIPEMPYHGHSLMISCPPRDHVIDNPGVSYPHKAPDLPSADLMRLLESSDNLPLRGEITPVQVLRVIRTHARFDELTPEDFKTIEEILKPQCRCYGFGAAVENFVVHDAIEQVFASKASGFNFNDPVG